MDHSLRGYLSRRTTEELEMLLKAENEQIDDQIIALICQILADREKELQ